MDPFHDVYISWCRDSKERPTLEGKRHLQEEFEKSITEREALILPDRFLGSQFAVSISRFVRAKEFKVLNLRLNVLRDVGCLAIVHLLTQNESIQELFLGGNEIGTDGCAAIAALVDRTMSLRVLDCGSDDEDPRENMFGSEAGMALAMALVHNESIEIVNLNRCGLSRPSQRCFETFARLLMENSHITVLKLGKNGIRTESAILIFQALQVNESLERLDLHGNDITSEVGGPMGVAFTNGAHALRVLDISNNPLGPDAIIPLCAALRDGAGVLEELNASNADILDEGAVAIADMLETNNTIVRLDVRGNAISPVGGTALARALVHNETLQFLLLSSNPIGDPGGVEIARCLQMNHSLTTLEMDDTRVGDEGLVAIGTALVHNETLKNLRLKQNHITDLAGRAFADIIPANHALLSLDLRGNQLDMASRKRIDVIIKRNRSEVEAQEPQKLERKAISLKYKQEKLQKVQEQLASERRSRRQIDHEISDIEDTMKVIHIDGENRRKDIQHQIHMETTAMEDMEGKVGEKETEAKTERERMMSALEEAEKSLEKEQEKRVHYEEELKELDAQYDQLSKGSEAREKEIRDDMKKLKKETEDFKTGADDYNDRLQRIRKLQEIHEAKMEEEKEKKSAKKAAPPKKKKKK
eukprot:TRINITY_DN3150_c0_g1_i1.p1 TRINITY_DN3150_c0_g1~~TRINITY_DN3150_c0_g1_i1.p1  ORF type:complete len:645 (-),score=215.91 TRINITY_DN3150_c0_g1_i1:1222-3156(-)